MLPSRQRLPTPGYTTNGLAGFFVRLSFSSCFYAALHGVFGALRHGELGLVFTDISLPSQHNHLESRTRWLLWRHSCAGRSGRRHNLSFAGHGSATCPTQNFSECLRQGMVEDEAPEGQTPKGGRCVQRCFTHLIIVKLYAALVAPTPISAHKVGLNTMHDQKAPLPLMPL